MIANTRKPKIGFILGDPAGIGPEIIVKTVAANDGAYCPVIVGPKAIVAETAARLGLSERLGHLTTDGSSADPKAIHVVDLPAGEDIRLGVITADSGRLTYEAMLAAIDLGKRGLVDALVMAPITKQAFHAADIPYDSEFAIFMKEFGVPSVKAVIKCGDIFRSTVVGHVRFTEIVSHLTADGVAQTTRDLAAKMACYPGVNRKIAVAALNPHAGEDGLFGDEEDTILKPAIEILLGEGYDVIGPCPADTVFLKALKGEVGGVTFLYHDQGNIAMKSSSFGDGVLLYTNTPFPITSVGHGSALDIAGKGIADERNLLACVRELLAMRLGDE